MTRARRRGLALGLALALSLVPAEVALADHIRAVFEVKVMPAEKLEQGYALSVRLRTTEGRPVNEATVRFYEVVELFGTREMLVATAATDGQGNASTTYLPARTGPHEIVVRFPGREHIAPAETRLSFEATVAAPPYHQEPAPLASFMATVPYGVGAIVLSVWTLIAFALFGTVIGVLRGTRDDTQKGDIA